MKKTGLLELNAVVAVSAHRSFRKASAELGMSPSALSHAVASLEQRMGIRLFNRTTRSVSLSEAGEQFLARVRPALLEIGAAMEGVNQFRETPSGTLRINTSQQGAHMVLPLVLEFLRRYPDMRLDLVTNGSLVDIVADGFDAGIRLAESVPLDMISVPCSPALLFAVVGSPAYMAGRRPPKMPDDLRHHICIRNRMPSGTPFKWEFEKGGEKIALDVTGPLTLDNSGLMVEAALAGTGLAWVSEWAVRQAIAEGRLVRLLEDWTPAYPGICLYYPGHRLVPAGLQAFIEVVREMAAGV